MAKCSSQACCSLPVFTSTTIPLKINGQSEKDELKRAFAKECLDKIKTDKVHLKGIAFLQLLFLQMQKKLMCLHSKRI